MSSIIRKIAAVIPILLLGAGLFLIHTKQSLVISGFESVSFATEPNDYTILRNGDGVLELAVPRNAETFSDILLTAERKIDVFPSIMGLHFRHDAMYGEDYGVYDSASSRYSFTLNERYIHRAALVLQQYELFFDAVLIAVLVYYLLFLLDCREADKGKNQFVPRILLAVLTGIIAAALNDGLAYLKNRFSYVSFHELIYHYNTDLGGANFAEFSGVFRTVLAHAGIILAAGIIAILVKNIRPVKNFFAKHRVIDLLFFWALTAAGFLLAVYPISGFFSYFNVFDYLAARHIPSKIFDEYYVEPATASITFPEEKKNLIYIYIESMEITPSDLEHGGIESVDTIPELTQLALENDCFNGDKQVLNGGIPLNGSTWTIAGMVAQSAGLPVKMGNWNSNSSNMLNSFLTGATALGDILEKEGYQNALVIGSDKKFGNRDDYFGDHGNYEFCDYNWAIETGRIPATYKEWWGYEDKKLFQYAKEKATEMAASGGNFNLTLLTADTHFVDGYVCDLCGDEFDRQYANVLRCASSQISDFVKWVQEQEWGKDTVIVLSGDHLYMDSTYYQNEPDEYRRKTYVSIINSAKPEPEEWKEYCTMDLFPTTLSAMGCTIEGDRLALGTDMYSDTPSLMVELGEDEINDELDLYSDFYENTLMLGK